MKTLNSIVPSLAFVALFAACNTSETPLDRTSTSASAIQGGEEDKVNFYRSSMSVCTGENPNTTPASCQPTCSATLIAPNLVLTARHCLFKFPASLNCATDGFGEAKYPETGVYFGTGNSGAVGSGTWYAPQKIYTPLSTAVCGSDLVLAILKRNVPASEAAPAEPIVANFPYEKSSEKLTAIGFGETSGSTNDLGTRHVRRGLFFVCLPGKLECSAEESNFAANEFKINGSGCPGDSGGGIFSEDSFKPETTAKQYGVLVRALSLNGQCLDNIYLRLDHYGKFIVDTAKIAAELGKYEAPAWTKTTLDSKIPGGPNYPRGELGSACNGSDECVSQNCISSNGGLTRRCATPCASDAECPSNFRCAGTPPSAYCFEKPPVAPEVVVEDPGGCSSTSAPQSGTNWGAFGAVFASLLALASRSKFRSRP